MSEMVHIELTVNGQARVMDVPAHNTLLEALRDELHLTGTKECCLVGECGVCTILVGGRTMNSCLVLAAEADGTEITTVEGLVDRFGHLSALQQAFLDNGAAQCGFCIPGQLISAHALLERSPHPTVEEIQEALAGNLCRCAGYEQITEAVLAAAEEKVS